MFQNEFKWKEEACLDGVGPIIAYQSIILQGACQGRSRGVKKLRSGSAWERCSWNASRSKD
ncbi:MAG: hypothetical protein ACK2TT_06655, partial [Anaerolineales bacterium]